MNKTLLMTLAALIALAAIAPAQAEARQYRHRPNVVIAPPAVVLNLPGFFVRPPAPRHGPAYYHGPDRWRHGPDYGPRHPRHHRDHDRYCWDRPYRRW